MITKFHSLRCTHFNAIVAGMILVCILIMYEDNRSNSRNIDSQNLDIPGNFDLVEHALRDYIEEAFNPDENRLILFWGNWFGHAPQSVVKSCPYRCEITTDETRAGEASVLVFNSHVKSGWPRVRFQNQTYVHLLTERPGPWQRWLADYDDRINLTWNYRVDADISTRQIVQYNDSSDIKDYVPRIPLASRSKSVVWLVSHCNASSERDEYANELAKHIDIDVYGRCAMRACPKDNDTLCLELFERNYKFYLAFENKICKDYITEKFYKVLQRELIPIVLGGGDYASAGPPYSYVDVKDFESPKALAHYLHHLSNDHEDYYAYFKWKSRYKLRSLEGHRSCTLCNVAHNSSLWRPAHKHYYNWWFSGCDDSLVDNLRAHSYW